MLYGSASVRLCLFEYVMCYVSDSLIKILSFATTMISDETHSLGLPDFPIDNVHAIAQILVICSFFVTSKLHYV